jgi:hypothetical protein
MHPLSPAAILLVMTIAAGCQEQDKAKTFLGPTAVHVLEQPTKVEAWRIRGEPGKPAVNSPATALDPALARDLAALLLDGRTYSFESAKGCVFQPGAGLRVWRGDSRST